MKPTVLLLTLTAFSAANAANILFIQPFPGTSHWIVLQNFIKELVNRGHNVTAISNFPISNFQSSNYTEVLIDPPFDLDKVFPKNAAFTYEASWFHDFINIIAMHVMGSASAEHGLATESIQWLINNTDTHFDLVISEEFFIESWLMFGYKFKAPTITISTYGYSEHFDRAMGMITPYSHVSNVFLTYSDDMTYWERCYNTYLSLYEWIFRDWVILPKQDALAKKYFQQIVGSGEQLPSIVDLYNQVSMILVMGHHTTLKPRPRMPGIVYVGGAHIKPPKPLPSDFQAFLDDANDGAILFTLGSLLHSSGMPVKKRAIFLQAFGQLKQKVIWKYEDESLPNVPANVLIRKWVPQSDILAHPNVVLFMSHGGMSGKFEGIARGVPILYIPLYGDQFRNGITSVADGNARMIAFGELSVERLTAEIREITTKPQYMDTAKQLSRLFNDHLAHPMDEAMHWIEYVIRSKGARHFKSKAVNMPLYSHLLLDVFFLPVAINGLLIALVVYVVRRRWGKKAAKKGADETKKTK